MNPIDAALSAISCVPCDARTFAVRAVGFVADAELLKGGVLVAILYGLWMTGRDLATTRAARSRVVMTLAGAFVALSVSRLLALALPLRSRPFEVTGDSVRSGARVLWPVMKAPHPLTPAFELMAGLALLFLLVSFARLVWNERARPARPGTSSTR